MVTQQPDPHLRRRSVFTVTVSSAGADKVVHVSGDLDLSTAPRLAEALRWFSHADTGELFVDTAELTFCDCAGLSELLAAAQRRQAQGGRLVLTNVAPILQRLSHLLGLDAALGLMPVHHSTTRNASTPNRVDLAPAATAELPTPAWEVTPCQHSPIATAPMSAPA